MLLQPHNSAGHTFARGIHLSRSGVIQFHPPSPIMWRQFTVPGWNLQLSIFFVCDWRAGWRPLKLDMSLGRAADDRTISSVISNPRPLPSYQNMTPIYPWILFMSVKISLSGGLIEGFFSWGVKERLRLLLQAELGKGCVLQESDCWM